ncbi:phosphonate ABC transporter ATP-binding protein [Roseococcus sp. SDR]|uniref:phosphonate ABC transporter ATP-binding protein n=1 Tax=Roseococcus sp. SDR TaxID=2835532 RepID=UPI002110EC46|nr:phosphonate ABC transporter ATP-binding protein [Roseococcus sp. SDR]
MIRTEALGVTYPNGTMALAPTSLDIAEGRFTVLLGPSGAGKSTLLRCLNGLVRPSEGRILVAGEPLAGSAAWRAHRRATGMVFQQHQLIGRVSVLGNVLTGRLGYHSSLRTLWPFARAEKRRALEALERVGLLDKALARADQLSGGQQQRVGIARALVQQPRLMLADEPVASLDPATAERVMRLLHEICTSDGLTAVVSLHQVDLARKFGERIIGLARGQVVFDGTAAMLDAAAISRIYGTPVTIPEKEFA